MAAPPHPSFPQPANPNVRVWRYMDLAKFIDLLQSERLFFATANNLGDPLEGSVTRHMSKDFLEDLIATAKPGDDPVWPGVSNQRALTIAKVLAEQRQLLCAHTYINCWHINEHESAAMWKAYSQSAESVCVQTRYSKLAAAFTEDVYLGAVKYIDYDVEAFDPGNLFNPFMHKRMSFKHENEVRAVFSNHPKAPNLLFKDDLCRGGARIKISVSELVEAVFVNPLSPAWFRDVIEGVVQKYGAKFPVRQSSLTAGPLY